MARRRLKTMSDLRRYLALLINKVEDGEVSPALAAKVGYLVNILRATIQEEDIEMRVAALERRVKEAGIDVD
jgi:hypothetical protein